jgi:hypothetical protein
MDHTVELRSWQGLPAVSYEGSIPFTRSIHNQLVLNVCSKSAANNRVHAPYLATTRADSSRRNAMKAEARIEGGIELKTVQVIFTSTMSKNPTDRFRLRHRNKMRMMIFTGKRTILGR